MLQIHGLTITHKKDLRIILQDFQLALKDGDKAVIIGEEGNGKSTLMKWIYRPELVEDYAECEGRRIAGSERLGYLPQEMPEQDKEKTVYEFFSEEERFFDQSPKDFAEYARNFQLDHGFFYSDQRMGSLSGGEKIKAQLIRLLMQEPTVLLLDEPSNDIDIVTLELLERIIRDWNHIVLYISHDETLIEHTANKIVHMEQIQRKRQCRYAVFQMSYSQYVSERLHRFEKQEQKALSDRREKEIRDEKQRRIYQSVEHAQNVISRQNPAGGRLLKKKMHAVKSMERRFEKEDAAMTALPEQEEAIFFKLGEKQAAIPAGKMVLEYELATLDTPDGTRPLSKNLFLRVKGPEKICIVGTNGSGKTTLLKKIAGQLLNRTDLHAEYMPQNYDELLMLDQTPVDYLDTSGDKEEQTRIRTYLGSLKFTSDEMDHPIRELSGGQKAKVLLLHMSLSKANVLILDEPTRNFSPLSGPVIRKMIREFPGAVISISHDRTYIEEVCDTVYELTAEGLIRSR
ncbi:MAG: ATP-binding cassette domain-containing protein [Lachnospiraceae bacterium]|nr:ATP-binding cassette domain-containing protein [Lachnospiraceae bacterium]